jgi:hypothetical protein
MVKRKEEKQWRGKPVWKWSQEIILCRCLGAYSPVGGAIVAVVGQEVIVQFPEDVEGDSPIGGRHIVVGFPEHGIKAVQCQEPTQQLVGHAIDFQEAIQLLWSHRDGCEMRTGPHRKGPSMMQSATPTQAMWSLGVQHTEGIGIVRGCTEVATSG